MDLQSLDAAIAEAERFLVRAKAARKLACERGYINSSKETGATRRASMDLTRALAEMRK